MTVKNSNSETAQPSQGFAHGVAPGVKWAVIIMGVMLIVGMVVVFSTIIYRTVKGSDGKSVTKVSKVVPYPALDLPLPNKGTVSSVSLDGNRMAVQITDGEGVSILVVDIKRGQVISRVRLSPPSQ